MSQLDQLDKPVPYTCSSCGKRAMRADLVVKRVAFYGFGRNGKMLRSRTIAWLCGDCKESDQHWNRDNIKGGSPTAPSDAEATDGK